MNGANQPVSSHTCLFLYEGGIKVKNGDSFGMIFVSLVLRCKGEAFFKTISKLGV